MFINLLGLLENICNFRMSTLLNITYSGTIEVLNHQPKILTLKKIIYTLISSQIISTPAQKTLVSPEGSQSENFIAFQICREKLP